MRLVSDLRSPLARARGLGAAGDGVGHWRAQRVSAIALAPLALWFVASLVARAGADHAEVVAWIARPPVAIALILMLGAVFWHLKLGMQAVIEDYVRGGFARQFGLLANAFVCAALAAASVFAVLGIALGA